eukprot:Blabericola_migrator_1__8527@NODE_4454_length_1149_cov_12_807763_g1273_i5_p4_GENE_NODE_4454_length_1149_cov_12_807763_g1273_i5NODE_4454_length_1149_cov_12_807763_g1273_i5_p4_ORF_typecomplete_len102_score1_45AC_N/PF16214_5/0_4_NODE_4454_length_1149_cov_12_807763_g1273_i57681073
MTSISMPKLVGFSCLSCLSTCLSLSLTAASTIKDHMTWMGGISIATTSSFSVAHLSNVLSSKFLSSVSCTCFIHFATFQSLSVTVPNLALPLILNASRYSP